MKSISLGYALTNMFSCLNMSFCISEDVPEDAKSELLARAITAAAQLEIVSMLEQLVVKDPTSIQTAIKEAKKLKRHKSIAFLKLVAAVIAGDNNLVSALYGESKDSSISQEVIAAVQKTPTKIPLKLAKEYSKYYVYRELLLHTGVRKDHDLEINWDRFGLENISDLYVLHKISSVVTLSLAHNKITRIEENFGELQKVCPIYAYM